MNDIERKLVELNQALLKLSAGGRPTEEMISQAQSALSGYRIDTGSGNDVVIINKNITKCDDTTNSPNPDCQCNKRCIVVAEDYQAKCDDYYIGVNGEDAVTITLPVDCETCCELVIKAEMGPPLGNRKVTIESTNGAFIDGKAKYVLEVPYESVRLICDNGDWFVI
jgi:hypothetical protein